MAKDIAFVLWDKFLNSLMEAESELSTDFPYISYFKDIKREMEKKTLAGACSVNVNNTLKWLYELNDLFAECRIFAQKKSRRGNKKLSQFIALLLDQIFFRKMRKRFDKFLPLPLNEEKMDEIQYENFIKFRDTYPEINDMDQNIGFQEQADKLESMLLNQSSELLKIGIVGMDGVGKTTLVKNVLSRPRLQKEFPNTLWICLTDIDVDETTLRRHIKEYLVFFHLKRKLIILDDVCRHSHERSIKNIVWNSPFLAESPHPAALIVTTTSLEVAEHMAGDNIIKLEPLTEEACWSIFVSNIRRSFEDIKTDHLDKDNHWAMLVDTICQNPTAMPMIRFENPNLEKLRNEIKGDYCQGLPLAAEVLAKFIRHEFFKQYYTNIF